MGDNLEREIYVETPTVSDALHLMMALRGFPTKLVEEGDRREVEIRPIPEADQLRHVLRAASNWLADRHLDSTRVRLGDHSYQLVPEPEVI
jgi:hypothetical protein